VLDNNRQRQFGQQKPSEQLPPTVVEVWKNPLHEQPSEAKGGRKKVVLPANKSSPLLQKGGPKSNS
jgi:hypothetical protein